MAVNARSIKSKVVVDDVVVVASVVTGVTVVVGVAVVDVSPESPVQAATMAETARKRAMTLTRDMNGEDT